MSKEHIEPLLPKSPPSPNREGSYLTSQKLPTKIAIIHYWSEYDSGSHKIFEMEINHNTRVLDLIIMSLSQFSTTGTDPNQFILRLADKSGKPKTHMPAFDIGQCIMETGSIKFALCQKSLEGGKKPKFDVYTEPVEKPEEVKVTQSQPIKNEVNPTVFQQKSKTKKSKICCCFNGD